MGCDIHCYVEKKIKDRWVQIKGFVSDEYEEGCDYFGTDRLINSITPIECRNYITFAVMADVRNGCGVKPIASQKGFPDDVSKSVRKEFDCDGHSVSWLTLEEIIDYKSKYTYITKSGYVTYDEYLTFVKEGKPESWCRDIGGGVSIEVENDSIAEISTRHSDIHVYTKIEWKESLTESCGKLFTSTLDQLKSRCDSECYDDVRLVFWFDS